MKVTAVIYTFSFLLFSELLFGRQNVYTTDQPKDDSEKYVIGDVNISGNKVTKRIIVIRELTFKEGDTVSVDELDRLFERSRDNLLKTSLFNFVYIDAVPGRNNLLDIDIKLEERWYTWPEIHFNHADRNFSAWWKSKDFTRINYGFGLSQYNFRGRKEKISGRAITGFIRQFAFSYDNIILDQQQRHILNLQAFYETRNRVEYITRENLPQLLDSHDIIFHKQNYILKYTYRNRLYNIHRFTVSYVKFDVSDTVISLNPEFLGLNRSKTDFMTFVYYFESDHTNLKYYPLTGSLFNARVSYSGLLRSDFNKLELRTGYYIFFKLYKRVYASTGLKVQLENRDRLPYVAIIGLGYDDFLRGYENYVIDGNNYLLLKSSIKYELLPVKIVKLNFLPIGQFNKIHFSSYLNFFFDAGYVHDYYSNYKSNNNNLVDKPLYTFGAGIDLVTYYDKMFRIDFAWNNIKETGIFISLEQKF